MTSARYRHYQRFRALLAAMDETWLPDEPRRLLEDLAEDMLLSRTTDPTCVFDTRLSVELTIGELTAVGVLPRLTAQELTRLLMAAGPVLAEPAAPELLPAL